jgi:hypothetical protein
MLPHFIEYFMGLVSRPRRIFFVLHTCRDDSSPPCNCRRVSCTSRLHCGRPSSYWYSSLWGHCGFPPVICSFCFRFGIRAISVIAFCFVCKSPRLLASRRASFTILNRNFINFTASNIYLLFSAVFIGFHFFF